jgi:hypothetical protein
MVKRKKISLKKNVAILACAVFISASFLGVTHAATRHPSREFYSPSKSFSSYSSAFSFINFNSPLVVIDLAMLYSLSVKGKKPPKKPNQPDLTDPTDPADPTDQPDPTDQTTQDKKDTTTSYGGNGNSGSKKKAKDKD